MPEVNIHTMKRKLSKGEVVIDNVSVRFTSRNVENLAVKATSVTIKPGEFVCILGPSGSGKSTLLNCVAGFVKPSDGRVLVDNVEVMEPGPDRGMVFQQYSLFPGQTIRENIAMGPLVTGRAKGDPYEVADTFLEMIGLNAYADSYPKELSGGMQQRVGIARALANYPDVLLMDEPFGALDSQTRLMMQQNLLDIWREFGITVLFVTHDVDEAVYLADRVLVMSAGPGEIIADIPIDIKRPRGIDVMSSPEFSQFRSICHEKIRAESIRAFEEQTIKSGE